MSTEDHSAAGLGTVMLDIGGEIGALVITAPAGMEGQEIEILPTGDTPHADPAGWSSAAPSAADGPAGGADHVHADGTTHPHHDDTPHLLHVAVHRRLAAGDAVWSAVFPELHEGTYDLHLRPDGPVRLAVVVTGGEVTHRAWPD